MLMTEAQNDLKKIMEDPKGFQWPITITKPDGTFYTFLGRSQDIGLAIDADTGTAISGRTATVAVSTLSLAEQSFELPEGVYDSNAKPWLVQFDDIQGQSYTFKIQSTMPDRTLSCIVCHLEAYTA